MWWAFSGLLKLYKNTAIYHLYLNKILLGILPQNVGEPGFLLQSNSQMIAQTMKTKFTWHDYFNFFFLVCMKLWVKERTLHGLLVRMVILEGRGSTGIHSSCSLKNLSILYSWKLQVEIHTPVSTLISQPPNHKVPSCLPFQSKENLIISWE